MDKGGSIGAAPVGRSGACLRPRGTGSGGGPGEVRSVDGSWGRGRGRVQDSLASRSVGRLARPAAILG